MNLKNILSKRCHIQNYSHRKQIRECLGLRDYKREMRTNVLYLDCGSSNTSIYSHKIYPTVHLKLWILLHVNYSSIKLGENAKNIKKGTYRSRLLKQNNTPKRVVNRNAKQTGTTMASISPWAKLKNKKGVSRKITVDTHTME